MGGNSEIRNAPRNPLGILPKKKKGYRPRSSAYITAEKVQEIIRSEPPRHALCIEVLFSLGLRASEVIGKYNEYAARPGIRPIDLDAEPHPEWGCNHTVRIWRKRGKFKILPLKDGLYEKIQQFIKDYNRNIAEENAAIRQENRRRVEKNKEIDSKNAADGKHRRHLKMLALLDTKPLGKEDRIFKYHRTTVYGWLAKYGKCVDTRYKIGIHTLRRSFGKHYRARGGKMEDLQKIYSHENMQQTMQYIGEDESTAMTNFAKMEAGQ